MIPKLVDKLCNRLGRVVGSDDAIDLGAAVTALVGDVAFDFSLAKKTNRVDKQEIYIDIVQVVHGGGAVWRVTKHSGFVLPFLNSIPLG